MPFPRRRILEAIVVLLGIVAALSPSAARASGAGACTTHCLEVCPPNEQWYDFCRESGCETTIFNCLPFGNCEAAMYCGTP
jgi:hypothetical protein